MSLIRIRVYLGDPSEEEEVADGHCLSSIALCRHHRRLSDFAIISSIASLLRQFDKQAKGQVSYFGQRNESN